MNPKNGTAVSANNGEAMKANGSRNRKSIIIRIVCICVPLLSAFTIAGYEPKKSTAEVEQIQGCYIFVDCKPVKEYEYLGTVKKVMSLGSEQYQDIRDKLIKKVKKEYPQADGILFNFKDGGTDRCDAIKFK